MKSTKTLPQSASAPGRTETDEGASAIAGAVLQSIPVDPFRALIFPNAIREQRRRKGYDALLMLASQLPSIPYIRLSKIERGEVIPKSAELREIAAVLGVAPASLLIDVDHPDYSVSLWAGLRGESLLVNQDAEEAAILLAAAFRARRNGDPDLTLARLQQDYGLPPVIVSRIENAVKTPDRWNAATMSAICRLLSVADSRSLYIRLRALHQGGTLNAQLSRIPAAREREERTRMAIAALRNELAHEPERPVPPLLDNREDTPLALADVRSSIIAPPESLLPVLGTLIADGLLLPEPTGKQVTAPPGTGPRSYALRMGRPCLGAAIPGHAVLIVDPDRYPINGGPAVIAENDALRVVAVCIDREGRMIGHSNSPEKAIVLDDIPPDKVAMVTNITFC